MNVDDPAIEILAEMHEKEREVFYKWLNRVCSFVKKELIKDEDVNTTHYSLTMNFPDSNDLTVEFEVTVTAKKV